MEMHKECLKKLLFWLGLTAASGIFLLPALEETLTGLGQTEVIADYVDGGQGLSAEEVRRQWEAAEVYNRKIEEEQKTQPFSYRGEEAGDPAYESLLSAGDGMMGYVEIETAGICLPVYHGTSSTVLAAAAGHLYGTSLPVGGPSTHAVLAAHTGFSGAELFNRLTEVSEGERFSLHVLGTRLEYEVDRILTVLPEETDDWLQIEAGCDEVTLYTCTPYGINDHRLLVRGRRTVCESDTEKGGEELVLRTRKSTLCVRVVLICMVPLLLLLEGLLRYRNSKTMHRFSEEEERMER